VYYLPPEDVQTKWLRKSGKTSFCEWKGQARYYDVVIGDRILHGAAFCYEHPTSRYTELAGFLSFYAAPMDSVTVDGEEVIPQPGGFYSGWITRNLSGPFKGSPGTETC
jgi:uncharacterized protein (DUF427 family)